MQVHQNVQITRKQNFSGGTNRKEPLRRKLLAALIVVLLLAVNSFDTTWFVWGAGGANAGLGSGTNNTNPKVIFPDDNFPAPKQVDTITDVEWTKNVDHQGYDYAYSQAKSQQYNGTPTPSHVVLKKADNSVNFFGYTSAPNCDYVYTDKYNNLNALNFTMRPVALNFHTFVQSGFLFNGKMTGNTFDGYAVILSVDGVLALHKGSWDMSQGDYTASTATRIATYATGISNGSTASYTVRVVIDPATRYFDVYINGAQRSSIHQAVANDHNGFGFYTSYTSHSCSQLTVMTFSNTRIDMIKAATGDPWSVLQKVDATVHYRLQSDGKTVIKPDTVQRGYIGQNYTITAPATITGSDGRPYSLVSTSRGQRIDPATKFTYDPTAKNNETTLYYVLSGPKGTISGNFWVDNNGNGQMDSGERTSKGNLFILYSSDDVNFAHPLTRRQLFGENDDSVYFAINSTGSTYTMTDIPAGKYSIRIPCQWSGEPDGAQYWGTPRNYGDGYDNKAVSATAADGQAHPYTANGKNWVGHPTKPTILNVIISTNGQQVTNQNIALTVKLLNELVASPASGSTISGSGQTITYGIRVWPHMQARPDIAEDTASNIKITQVLPKGMRYAGGQSAEVRQTAYESDQDHWPANWDSAGPSLDTNNITGPAQTTLADGRIQLVWTIDKLRRGHALLIQFNGATHGPGYYETSYVLDTLSNSVAVTSNTVAHATGQAAVTERYVGIDGQPLKAETSVMVNNAATYTAAADKTASITPPPSPAPPGGFTYDYAGFLLGDAEYNSYTKGTNMPGTKATAVLRTGTPTFGPVNGNATVYFIFDKHRQKVTERYRVLGDASTVLAPNTTTQQTQHDPYYLPISKLTPITGGSNVYSYVGYSVNGDTPVNASDILGSPDFLYSQDALIPSVSDDSNYVVLWYKKNPSLNIGFEQCDVSGNRINPGTALKPPVANSISAGEHAFFSDEWTKQFVVGSSPGTKYTYYGYSTDGGATIIPGKPDRDMGILKADLNMTLYFANVRQVTVHFVEHGNPYYMVSADRSFLVSSGNWDPQSAASGKLFDDMTVIDDPTDPNDRGRVYVYQGYNWTDDPYAGDSNVASGKPGNYSGTGDGALTLYFSTYYNVNMRYHEYLSNAELASEIVPATLMGMDTTAFKGGSAYTYPAPPQTLNALGRDGLMYVWTYQGYKMDNDKALLQTGSPAFTKLWGQRDIICIYKRGAATDKKTITERFREQGNEANTLLPNNQINITGSPATYTRAAGTPPARLADPQSGTVFALVGYQWDDVNVPVMSDFSDPNEAKRTGITESHTITYLYSAKRVLFDAICDGTAANSVADNSTSTKLTIVFDNVLQGSLAFSNLQIGGAAYKSGTDFLNAAEIAGGMGGGWDGKTFEVALTPKANALEGDAVSVTATITDPGGFYDPAFLNPSGTTSIHVRHKAISAVPDNPLTGTAWIDVVFESANGALPLDGLALRDIRILPDSDGGMAYASRLIPHAAGNSGPPILGELPDGYHFSIELSEVTQSGHVQLWFNGNSDRFKVIGDPLIVEVVQPIGGGSGMTHYQFVNESNSAYVYGSSGAQLLPDFSKQTAGVQKYALRVGRSADSIDPISSKYLDYGNGTNPPTNPELTNWMASMVNRSFEVLAGDAALSAGIAPGTYDLYTDGAQNVIEVLGSYYVVVYRSLDFVVIGYQPYTGNPAALVHQKHHPPGALRNNTGLYIDGVLVDYFATDGSTYLSYYNVYDGTGLSGPDWFTATGHASLPDTTFFYLQPHYVMPQDNLSNGAHTIYIRFTDGYALGQFTKDVSAPPQIFGDTIEVVRGSALTGHALRVDGLPFPDVKDAAGAAFPEVTATDGPNAGSAINGVTLSGSTGSEGYSLDISTAAAAVAGDLPRFRLLAANMQGGTSHSSDPAEYLIRIIDAPGAPLSLFGHSNDTDQPSQVAVTWEEPEYLGNTPLLGYDAKASYYDANSGDWSDWQPLGVQFDAHLSLNLPPGTSAYAVQVWAYNKVGAGPQAVFVKAVDAGGSGGGGTGMAPFPPPGGTVVGSVTNDTDEYVDVDIFLEIGDQRLSSPDLKRRYINTNDFIALSGLAPGSITSFLFEHIPDGYYNVVSHIMPKDATPVPDPPDRSYYITRGVAVTDGEASSSVNMTLGRKQSVVEIMDGSPELSVDGLDLLFSSGYYTDDDQAIIEAGGVVEFKLYVAPADAGDVATIVENAHSNGERALSYFDLEIVKTRYAQGGGILDQVPVPELAISNYLTLAVPLDDIRGKTAAHVYRVHAGVSAVERLEPNADLSYQNSSTWSAEIFNQDQYLGWLLLRTGKFSAYGVSVKAYPLTVTVEGQGSVAGIPGDTLLIKEEEVGLTAQPSQGWRFVEWRVSNAQPNIDGNSLVMLMPASAVDVVAVFEQTVPPGAGASHGRGKGPAGNAGIESGKDAAADTGRPSSTGTGADGDGRADAETSTSPTSSWALLNLLFALGCLALMLVSLLFGLRQANKTGRIQGQKDKAEQRVGDTGPKDQAGQTPGDTGQKDKAEQAWRNMSGEPDKQHAQSGRRMRQRIYAIIGTAFGLLGVVLYLVLERIEGEMVLANLRTPLFALLLVGSLFFTGCAIRRVDSIIVS